MSARDPQAERELLVMSAAMIAAGATGAHAMQFAITPAAADEIAEGALVIARKIAERVPCCEGCGGGARAGVNIPEYLNQLERALDKASDMFGTLCDPDGDGDVTPTDMFWAREQWRVLLAQNGAKP